jgi:hypothetical protein
MGSICGNIILQMNAKMGNPLWHIESPKTLAKKTMLVGIDIYHHNKKNSYVGFVASCDPKFTKYYTKVRPR